MQDFFKDVQLSELQASFLEWIDTVVLTGSTGYQALAVLVTFFIATLLARPLQDRVHDSLAKADRARLAAAEQFSDEINDLMLPLIWLILQWGVSYLFASWGVPNGLLIVTTSLTTAWVIIRFMSGLIKSKFWSRVVATVAWAIAALNILGLLDETRTLLDSLALTLGDIRISALSVVEGLISLVILLWVANVITRLVDQQVYRSVTLTPSIKVLISKLTQIGAFGLAILLALGGAGIDLTALTIFSGALGIGVGFGLQKIVANFISGIILLLDKSVKPGDNIVVADTFGWIDKLNARYASVITRDGTEHLIPNEDLITQRVENWSYTNRLLRLRMPIGVSYESDIHKAIALCEEAAAEIERIKENPAPRCLLRGFGDNAVDLELRAWIDDPQNGRGGVMNDCLLKVWDKFQEHGIEFPYPQRDVHIKSIGVETQALLEESE